MFFFSGGCVWFAVEDRLLASFGFLAPLGTLFLHLSFKLETSQSQVL